MKENLPDHVEVETIDTPWATFKIENSIIYVIYKKGVVVDLPAAKEIAAARLKLLDGRSFPGLTDIVT